MQADIDFSWWRERNPSDYAEWGPPLPKVGLPSFYDVVVGGLEPRIKAKGVCLERYQPLQEFPDLFARFAKLKSQADAAKFIRTFGPLTADGLQGGDGDRLLHALSQAHNIRGEHLHVGFVVTSLDAKLRADHDGIHLKVEPPDLLSALWLQFAEARSKGLADRCKQCGALFATGPDGRRRRGAEFCSIKCKAKFHSLKRSRG
jgi:hypothetical protein